MGYEQMGRLHAALAARGARDDGQGTVEYVGVVLLVSLLIAAVAAKAGGEGGTIADTVAKKVDGMIKTVGAK